MSTTTSIRQQIINAAMDLINSNAPAGFPVAEAARPISTDTASFPCILVYRASETETLSGPRNSEVVKRQLHFRVHVRVASYIDTAESPEEVAEQYLDYIWDTLAGQHLAGVVTSLTAPQTDWTLDISDVGICEGIIEFVAEYTVARPKH